MGAGWPLNHHFIFDLVVIITVFIILLSLTLPQSSEKKRVAQSTTHSTLDHNNTDTITTNKSLNNMAADK